MAEGDAERPESGWSSPRGEGRSPQELPAAERRRRRRELWISGFALTAIASLILVRTELSGPSGSLPMGSSLLFLLLNALNVILVVLLIYLIARNFVKLFFERRRGILGSHLHWKFVSAQFLVATVPTALVFLVSYTFVTDSIDTWFSLQVDGALDRSREVADAYYDAWAQGALHYGGQISEQIRDQRLLREESREALEAFVQGKQREYDLGVVQIFPYAESFPLITSVNPEIPAAAFVQRESPIVAAALAGESATLVEGTGSELGDVIRGAVPILSSDPERPAEVVGALVVNYLVPHALAGKVAEIRAAFDQYRAVQPYAGHIAWVYQIELLLFSLVILLFALWWGSRFAKGVTHSIRALAESTAEVARGNLDIEVEPQSDDEVGFLVRSFNRMTRDLRDARAGLEHSNTELESRRRYMEIVLRNVDAGVASFDAEGRISTINPSAQRLLGVPPGGAAVGHKLEEVTSRVEYLEVIEELRNQTRSGVRESVRKQVQVSSGDEVLTLAVTFSLLQDDDGRSIGAVVVFDDYTQEVRAQRMAAWREVARRIAHEIKNPLTPIQLSAQRIRRRLQGRLGDPQDAQLLDECIETITHEVEGLKVLVNEFSNFARLPAARPRPSDLNRVVESAVASYAGTEGVRFETVLDASLPTVDLDVDQMRRVLTNLIDNAIAATVAARPEAGSPGSDGDREATASRSADSGGSRAATAPRRGEAPPGTAGSREATASSRAPGPGTVEVRTLWDAPLQTARIEIADDGVGIRSEDRRRIFEPYFSTKPHGTGLGLAIVSRIVADHHGYIRVHANRPRGTRFIVELPARA